MGRYGAAASQDFTPYENFQGKARSVLLIVYFLFLKVFLEKRKDLLDNVFSEKRRSQILSCFRETFP
ncbi:hypothetical protein D3Q42_15710 [Salmonella enterica]|nr:hypothetical protein [Salmonella enterica]EBX0003149.1 hypothetical protein [Salmonella enterica subsp. enterica serovar Anatum]EBK0542316.1 hypothetical protein [Salmonella enterica]EBL7385896.1 hypothetical protein [Salmonella enterica]EBO3741859.1 hypothetical protein [Salmonella enterica]